MIYIVENGAEYSDYRLYFVETDRSDFEAIISKVAALSSSSYAFTITGTADQISWRQDKKMTLKKFLDRTSHHWWDGDPEADAKELVNIMDNEP
jgi:hypothetical protein